MGDFLFSPLEPYLGFSWRHHTDKYQLLILLNTSGRLVTHLDSTNSARTRSHLVTLPHKCVGCSIIERIDFPVSSTWVFTISVVSPLSFLYSLSAHLEILSWYWRYWKLTQFRCIMVIYTIIVHRIFLNYSLLDMHTQELYHMIVLQFGWIAMKVLIPRCMESSNIVLAHSSPRIWMSLV